MVHLCCSNIGPHGESSRVSSEIHAWVVFPRLGNCSHVHVVPVAHEKTTPNVPNISVSVGILAVNGEHAVLLDMVSGIPSLVSGQEQSLSWL